jgi:nodulation protein A
MDHLRWRLVWESDLSDEEHAALARLFGRAYPRHAERFSGGRSWSGARPEARVVGSLDDRPVAHLGLLRRFLRVPATGASLLVGDVGLVAVDPDLQGRGIGRRLLDQARQVLLELELPFGFLTCGPETVPFYRSGGWRLLEGQTTRMIDNRQRSEVYQGPALLLPVRARLTDWPHGHTVDRNGLEV